MTGNMITTNPLVAAVSFLTLAATVFCGLASCSDDGSPGMSTVEFDIMACDAPRSRATGDASGIDQLVYLLLDDSGEAVPGFGRQTAAFSGGRASVSLRLVNGRRYRLAMWAQKSGNGIYTVSDGMVVTVDYSGSNNDEGRDAFYGCHGFKVDGNSSVSVTLKRALAQVNLGCTSDDWTAAEGLGLTVTRSSATLSRLANTLDIAKGTVSGEVSAEFSSAPIPSDRLLAEGGQDGYVRLSTCYVLPQSLLSSSTSGVSFTLSGSDGKSITVSSGLDYTPLRSNGRTNIVGRILTGETALDISLDTAGNGDFTEEYGSKAARELQRLRGLFTDGGEMTLDADVDLRNTNLTLAAGKTATLDLGGHTITKSVSGAQGTSIINQGTLSIRNGTIKNEGVAAAPDFNDMAYAIYNMSGTLTLEGVSVGTPGLAGTAVYNAGGTALITGGDFKAGMRHDAGKCHGRGTVFHCIAGTMTVSGATSRVFARSLFAVNGPDARIIVNGGDYANTPSFAGRELKAGEDNANHIATVGSDGGSISLEGGTFEYSPGPDGNASQAVDAASGSFEVSSACTLNGWTYSKAQ